MKRDGFSGVLGTLAASALVLVAGASACSSEFGDCSDARSCPASAGAGGSGSGAHGSGGSTSVGAGGDGSGDGAGGEAGGDEGPPPLPVSCVLAIDCDDGSACTGSEVCVDGRCAYGPSPCSNADPEHCEITCTDTADGPMCGLQGVDLDKDGYREPACADNPGEDCNDAPGEGEEIHPRALEICNENVDDDCDGEDELTDEVVLGGEHRVLVAPVGTSERDQPAIAANPSGGFGVTWMDHRFEGEDLITSEIYYVQLRADGTSGKQTRLTLSDATKDQRSPDLHWGSDGFGVGWIRTLQSDGSTRLGFARVPESGELFTEVGGTAPRLTGATELRVVWYSATDPDITENAWQVFSRGSSLRRLHVPTSGPHSQASTVSLGGGTLQSFDASSLANGTMMYVSSVGSEEPSLFGEIIQPDTDKAITTSLPGGSETDVAVGGDYFAYRFSSGPGIRLQSVTNSNCSISLPEGIPVAFWPFEDARILLYWDIEQTALYIRVVHDPSSASTCELGPRALVVEQTEDVVVSNPDMAVDPEGNIAVVWTQEDKASGEWSIMTRLFTPSLCE